MNHIESALNQQASIEALMIRQYCIQKEQEEKYFNYLHPVHKKQDRP